MTLGMRWRLPILLFPFVVPFVSFPAHARYAEVIEGRQYTLGLSVISAPSAGNEFNVPGNIPIAIDVSNDGRVADGATSRVRSIELYLVSSSADVNMTISGSNARLIDTEPGSTVKHVTFPLNPCLPPGPYNVTLYDSGTYENKPYYTITSVPINLKSDEPRRPPCPPPAVSRLLAQPQPDAPLPFPPFAPGGARDRPPAPDPPNALPPDREQQGGNGEQGGDVEDEGDTDDDDATKTAVTQPATTLTTSPIAQQTPPPTRTGIGEPAPSPSDGEGNNTGGDNDDPPPTGTDDQVDEPSEIPEMPEPVPEQIITIHGGFIVPVLADSAVTLMSRASRAIPILVLLFQLL